MRRVLTNFGWLSAASLFTQLLGAGALLYVARRVGPNAFGMLAFVQATANLGFAVGDMGLGRLGTKFVSTKEQVVAPADIVCLRVFLNVAVLSIMVLVLAITGTPRTEVSLLILTAAASTCLALAPEFVWTGIQELRTFGILQTAQLALRAGGIIVLVTLTRSVASVPLATMIAALLGSVALWALLPAHLRKLGRFEIRRWPGYLVSAVPIGLAALMPNVYVNSDTIMVKAFLGLHSLAEYAAAYRLLLVPLTVAGLFVTALFPALCQVDPETEEGRHLLRRALALGTGAGLLISLSGFLASGHLLVLLYGAAYRPAGSAFAILILVPAVAIPAVILSSATIAAGHTKFNLAVIGGGGVINLGLDAALLPPLGIQGAGLATLAAESTVLVALLLRWRLSTQSRPRTVGLTLPREPAL